MNTTTTNLLAGVDPANIMDVDEDFYILTESYSNSWFMNDKSEGEDCTSLDHSHITYGVGEQLIKVKLYGAARPASGLAQARYLEVPLCRVYMTGRDHTKATVHYCIDIDSPDFLGCTMSREERAFSRLNRFLMANGYGCLKKEAVRKIQWLKGEGRGPIY